MAYRRLLALHRLLTLPRPLILHSRTFLISQPIPSHRLLSSADKGNDVGRSTGEVTERIREIIRSDKVVVFMKGEPDRPMCGFSKAVVQILQLHGVRFSACNVLEDGDIRAGVKEHSGWPTIPQVFFNGELMGGMDILLQMHQTQELPAELEKIGITSKLAPNDNDA